MRLRFVYTCHFGKSEATNFAEVVAKHPEFVNADSKFRLKSDDVVLLVAKSENQLIFVHGFEAFADSKDATQLFKVLRSTRFRLAGSGRWNPLMLANYAKSVGIVLHGLAEYEEHVKKLLKS